MHYMKQWQKITTHLLVSLITHLSPSPQTLPGQLHPSLTIPTILTLCFVITSRELHCTTLTPPLWLLDASSTLQATDCLLSSPLPTPHHHHPPAFDTIHQPFTLQPPLSSWHPITHVPQHTPYNHLPPHPPSRLTISPSPSCHTMAPSHPLSSHPRPTPQEVKCKVTNETKNWWIMYEQSALWIIQAIHENVMSQSDLHCSHQSFFSIWIS